MNPETSYANPEAVVSTEWVSQNIHNPNVRIVESNEDVLLYSTGHIENAVHIDWTTDLQDSTIRDYISPEQFAALCSKNGISPDTEVVFYGDKSNWWACYAFWVFRLFGHKKLHVMNGGRDKWIEEGRPLTRALPQFSPTNYPVPRRRRDSEIRAFFEDTLAHSNARLPLVDVRTPGEFRGEITHMPEYPQEGVLRGGHIPGAKNIPWRTAVNPDSTFKSAEELRKIYIEQNGLNPSDDIIAYCRIGERSSHTWFVLTELLGFEKVRNYDGSWTEWGNRVRAPIEKG
ncbi:MAG: sulfurtransferase [Chthoniobacterales bacterium]|nr:sulfurtransferase [Chthoniobacterales bacterium]